jgi:NAD-dependent DNA ligase
MRLHQLLFVCLFFLGSAAGADDIGQRIMQNVDRNRHQIENLRNYQGSMPITQPGMGIEVQQQINALHQQQMQQHIQEMERQKQINQATNEELKNSWLGRLATASSGMPGRTGGGFSNNQQRPPHQASSPWMLLSSSAKKMQPPFGL